MLATALLRAAEPSSLDELSALAAAVPDGEHLVVAVPNRVGPVPSPFDRLALLRVARATGLQARVLGALPDHRAPRLVFADELLDDARTRHLARTVPSFADLPARQAWGAAVDAGLAGWLAPSLVLIARRGGAPNLWPPDRLAMGLTTNRHPELATVTVYARRGGSITIERRRLAGDDPVVVVGPTLTFDARPHPWVDGDDLVERLVSAAAGERARLVRAWRDLVPTARRDGALSLDAVPRNCVVRADGTLALIDEEWWSGDATVDDVARRGVLLTALDLAARGCGDALALAGELAPAAGVEAPDAWLDAAVTAEAALRTAIELLDPDDVPAKQAAHEKVLRDALYPPPPPEAPPPGPSIDDLRAEIAVHVARLVELEEALDTTTARADHAERELRERDDEAVVLRDEIDHLRRSLAASAELLSREAGGVDDLRRRLAERPPSDDEAAAELAALKATKLLRWSKWPRRAYARWVRPRGTR